MDYPTKRRIVYGLISLLLTTLAAKAADYITDWIVGKPAE